MIHLQRLVLSSFLLLTCSVGQAQVFIPDQIERLMLNDLIPGIVDAGGVMDTLHPGIKWIGHGVLQLPSDASYCGSSRHSIPRLLEAVDVYHQPVRPNIHRAHGRYR
ncbi:MAG: hypothetical protein IPO56_14745 [Flavobacteriales bacterium]|nr:hypothetical protein [Flavobacteriales bacterium]